MKVPEARKLPSGTWFIQLRLGGESIPVTAASEKACIREAQSIKADYLAGKRKPKEQEEEKETVTLAAAMDNYIKSKDNTLSPATIRGYRKIQKFRFQSIMQEDVEALAAKSEKEWQVIVNNEAGLCSPKYLKNAFGFVKGVIRYATGKMIPEVKLSSPVPSERAFLMPDEILPFVEAVKGTFFEIPALLALSSMRISEIQALDWKDIPKNPEFIKTAGAVVLDSDNKLTKKKQGKNITSSRNVPILIPSLKEALERERKPSGPVMDITQDRLRDNVHKVCKRNGLTDVSIHGLRHSFASLAYHLRMPEKIAMEIGGWSDPGTMNKIYTHIAKSDITRYQTEMAAFYSGKTVEKGKNANENANEK